MSSDFELYAPLVRAGGLVALHDIATDSRIYPWPVEVPQYWRELKAQFPAQDALELLESPDQNGMGIGVLKWRTPEKELLTQQVLHTPLQQAATAIMDEVEGHTILVNTAENMRYELNFIEREIWDMLAEPTTIAALCETLQGQYEVDATVCRRDVVLLLQELLTSKLILFGSLSS